jgi:hypothetical protein
MRRGLLVMLALLPLSATAWAQVQVVPPTSQLFVSPDHMVIARVNPALVVNRIMSFDRNNDGRVEKGELAERMHNVLTRGDINHDGALDGFEIQKLATAPRAQTHGAFGSGGYGFADQSETSSRFHIEDSLEDLRLQSPTKELALAAVAGYVDRFEEAALADLLRDMEGLLAPEQLVDFKWAVKSQLRRTPKVTSIGGANAPTANVVVRRTDLGQLVQHYGLARAQNQQARIAIESYKRRLRLDDTKRSELLDQVKDILSDEERGNLRAALDRRPMVANGAQGLVFRVEAIKGGVRKEVSIGGGFQNLLFVPTPID